MSNTKPSYYETLFGVLSIKEIESLITDNLILTRFYIASHYYKLTINGLLLKDLHKKLAGNIFETAGNFRKTEVQVGNYKPPKFFEIEILIKNWEADYQERSKHDKTEDEKIETLAWLMHRLLWIHPFFDYNGRITRLIGEIYLMQNNLPVISFKGTKRSDFAEAMKYATNNNDLSKIIKIIHQ